MRLLMTKRHAMLAAALPVALAGLPVDAATLTDLTSTIRIETQRTGTGLAGVVDWEVTRNGVTRDHMKEEGFWFRTGTDDREYSLHSLDIVNEKASDTNFNPGDDVLDVLYERQGQFTAEVKWTLVGTAGGCCSDLGEQIKLTNTGNQRLSITLFEYTDFDLNGLPGIGDPFDDVAKFVNSNEFMQRDFPTLADTVVVRAPDRWEIGYYDDLRRRLDDDMITDLMNATSPLKNGDLVWAAQWNFTIDPGLSVIISKDKLITTVVPLPASALLLMSGLAGLAVLRRQRRAGA